MKVKLLEPIEGFEDVAEYRVPNPGECYINAINGQVENAITGSNLKRIVLTPIKRWRPATIDDAVSVSKGVQIYARFREKNRDEWMTECFLTGVFIRCNKSHVWYSQYRGFDICEVLDA